MFIIGCSTNGSDDWPKMEADNLWQELEQTNAGPVTTTEEIEGASNQVSLSSPHNTMENMPVIDIRVTLEEIDRDLPLFSENMARALDKYEAANEEDKELHWRGVEIEISRLNEAVGQLRMIEYQLSTEREEGELLRRAKELLSRVNFIIPDKPDDLSG